MLLGLSPLNWIKNKSALIWLQWDSLELLQGSILADTFFVATVGNKGFQNGMQQSPQPSSLKVPTHIFLPSKPLLLYSVADKEGVSWLQGVQEKLIHFYTHVIEIRWLGGSSI